MKGGSKIPTVATENILNYQKRKNARGEKSDAEMMVPNEFGANFDSVNRCTRVQGSGF